MGLESEKVTVNLGHVDLGQIDLLVREGFYSNRTDLIRTAIRNQLRTHEGFISAAIARDKVDVGLRRVGRAELDAAIARGEPLRLRVLGLAVIDADVTAALAREGIARIHVLGALQASPSVRAALADRMA